MTSIPPNMIQIDFQNASQEARLPSQQDFQQWAEAALKETHPEAELSIRIVDNDESKSLNHQYRGKDKPTNVLSFPFEIPEEIAQLEGVDIGHLIGDLVISAPIVIAEAKEQHKSEQAHWAHMVIHGCLHLVGHDHIKEEEAEVMEGIECQKLAQLGYPDPYIANE